MGVARIWATCLAGVSRAEPHPCSRGKRSQLAGLRRVSPLHSAQTLEVYGCLQSGRPCHAQRGVDQTCTCITPLQREGNSQCLHACPESKRHRGCTDACACFPQLSWRQCFAGFVFSKAVAIVVSGISLVCHAWLHSKKRVWSQDVDSR